MEDQGEDRIEFDREGREAVKIEFDQEGRGEADIDWVVDQWEDDIGPAADRRGVDNLDLGSGMDYWGLAEGMRSGNLLDSETYVKRIINHLSCLEREHHNHVPAGRWSLRRVIRW